MEEFKRDVKFNIYQRINGVMSEVDYIEKEKKQVNGMYRFVSHDAVSAKLHPFLAKYGIVIIPNIVELVQEANRTTCKLEVSFVNIDKPDDRFSVFYYGYGLDSQDKGIGKAVSYAFKYAMLKTFCLETGDDPETDVKTEFKPIDVNIEKKNLDVYLDVYADEDKPLMIEYFHAVSKANKITITDLLLRYENRNLFEKKFMEWKNKKIEKENNAKN